MEKSNETVNIRTSLLNLVDLAGSERQKDTHAEGMRLKVRMELWPSTQPVCELITRSQYQGECVEVTKEWERAPILKTQKFLLWGRDIKHKVGQNKSLGSQSIWFEVTPEGMTVQISARVRGRRDWTAWGKHGKEVVLELGSQRGQDLDWERATGNTCLAGRTSQRSLWMQREYGIWHFSVDQWLGGPRGASRPRSLKAKSARRGLYSTLKHWETLKSFEWFHEKACFVEA